MKPKKATKEDLEEFQKYIDNLYGLTDFEVPPYISDEFDESWVEE